MENSEILKSYIPMVDFIADVCGPNFEVLLHDVSKPESSVIAIRNGHITGRKIGSPMTDLALKVLKQKDYLERDFITNYDGYGEDGKIFLSSTYYIKNSKQELIGLICVNNDIADIKELKRVYEMMMKRFEYRKENEAEIDYKENIEVPLTSIAHSIISKTIESINVPPERMSIKEKVNIVQELNDKGVFLLKGAIADVAKQLQISETTVYRYLNKK